MSVLRATLLCVALAGLAAGQAPLTIATSTLPTSRAGVPYLATMLGSGGFPPYTWTATNLPPGLVLNGGGTISGNPGTAGTFNAMIALKDTRTSAISRQFSITIAAPQVSIVTPSPLPNGMVGQSYNQTLTATEGTAPYRWAASLGFPSFWALNPATGAITGTPTVSGTLTFSVQATDAAQVSGVATFTVTILPPLLAITTIPPLFNGIVDTPYAQTFSASGGVPPYTWTVISGATGGLTLSPNTGILQGTPPSTGTFTFTLQVADKAGAVVVQSYAVVINPPTLTISVAGELPAGAVGAAYSQKLPLAASGGIPPYSWSLTSGAVPGLILDSAGISLAGTPTTAGTFNMTVQVVDTAGLKASKSLSLTIAPATLAITVSRQLRDTAFNTSFSQALTATGGNPPYTWTANGLPTGLMIDASSGVIAGIPAAAGSFSFAVTVTDSTLKQYSDRFSINVILPVTPSVTIAGLPASIGAVKQFPLQITLDSSFPVDITGQVFLNFAPDSGPVDRTIQFASGGTIASFSIPAGSTTAVSDVPLAIQTGSVAGTLTITLRLRAGVTDITPGSVPTVSAQLARAAPVVADVQVNRTSTAISVVVTGYSVAREVTQMTFNFTAVSGQSLQPSASAVVVSVDTIFASWYQDPVNGQYGSQFVFTQPFTVQGDPNQVKLTSVVLTNRVGSTTTTVDK